MKKTLLTKTLLLLFALIAGSSSSWADTYTLQLESSKKFSASGLTDGSIIWSATNNSASIGNWSTDYKGQQFGTSSTKGNVVLSTSSISGTITQVDIYSQTGTSGGATVAVSVDGTSWGSQNMKVPSATGEDPGQLTFSGSKTGTIQITLTQTKKKAMYLNKIVITYTPSSTPSSGVSFATENPSIDWPTALTYTQTATTASGYSSTAGASVIYSIGSTNTCGATIDSGTGEVTPTKGGSVQVVATAAAIDGHFTQSTASYTLTVNDVRPAATLSWSEDAVEIMKDAASYTLPTLNNPNSLDVTYSATGTDGLATVNSSTGVVTVNTGIVGSATIKASFAGNNSYKPKTATYTINVVDPTVKGSKYNPYTVSEVISGTATGSNIYVTGYIVGNYNATAPVNPATGDTNFALAEASDETDGAKTIPVELKGTIRNTWGPQTNKVIGYEVQLKGNVDTYFGVSGIKGTSEVTALSIPATIGTSGYITLGAVYDLDHLKATPTDGLEAYVVTAVSGSAVTLEAIPHIPAGTGVILKGTPGTTYTIPVFQHGYTVSTNLLKISDGNVKGGDGIYALAEKSGTVGFYKVAAEVYIPRGKCYLNTNTSAPDYLSFGGDATGINAVNGSEFKVNGEYYNLAGQRVAQPTKGLYIVNGKKVVMK